MNFPDFEEQWVRKRSDLHMKNYETIPPLVSDIKMMDSLSHISHEQIKAIIEGVADGILVQDSAGKVVYANEAAAYALGFASRADLLATPTHDLVRRFEILDEEGRPFPLEQLPGRRALRGEPAPETVLCWRPANTEENRWSIVKARPFFDTNGQVAFAINIFHDITPLKEAESSQKRYVRRLAVLEHLGRAILVAKSGPEIGQIAIEHMEDLIPCQYTGVLLFDWETGQAEMIAGHLKTEREIVPGFRMALDMLEGLDELRAGQIQYIRDLHQSASPLSQMSLLREEGLLSVLQIPLIAGGNLLGLFNLGTDQPDAYSEEDIEFTHQVANVVAIAIQQTNLREENQRHAEELERKVEQRTKELAESEQRYRSVISNVPVVLFVTDTEGVFTLSEGQGLGAIGLDPGEVIGRSAFEMYAHIPEIPVHLQRALAGETFTAIVKVNGVSFETWYSPLLDQHQLIRGVIGVAIDITERQQAEQTLRRFSRLEERQRIAAELHDGLIQTLYFLGLSVDQLMAGVDSMAMKTLATQFAEIRTTIDRALQEGRHSIAELQLAPQLPESLQDQLFKLAEEFMTDTTPLIDLMIPSDPPLHLTAQEARQITHTVREALLNACRHASAYRISLRLEITEHEGTITVVDDGQGFDPQDGSIESDEHFGLEIMQTRTAQIGGQLTIQSSYGHGTQIQLSWPLQLSDERGNHGGIHSSAHRR